MKQKKQRQKKQFRLYDIYRYVCVGRDEGEIPNVFGIESFYCNADLTLMQVNGHTYTANNEDELRKCVYEINKQLGNCSVPGRKTFKSKNLCLSELRANYGDKKIKL